MRIKKVLVHIRMLTASTDTIKQRVRMASLLMVMLLGLTKLGDSPSGGANAGPFSKLWRSIDDVFFFFLVVFARNPKSRPRQYQWNVRVPKVSKGKISNTYNEGKHTSYQLNTKRHSMRWTPHGLKRKNIRCRHVGRRRMYIPDAAHCFEIHQVCTNMLWLAQPHFASQAWTYALCMCNKHRTYTCPLINVIWERIT